MTSFAFILGVVPLMLSEGAGAEMRRTLGTAVFAGMLGVTLFGIFLTPVFYYVIQWFKDRYQSEVGDDEELHESNPLTHFISGLGHGLKEIEGRQVNGRRFSPEPARDLGTRSESHRGDAAPQRRPLSRLRLSDSENRHDPPPG